MSDTPTYTMAVLDKENMCRTCLNPTTKANMQNIFTNAISIKNDSNEVVGTLSSIIMACATVEIALNDDLPSHICMQCLDCLIKAFSFKQMCEQSDTKWRQVLNSDDEDNDDQEDSGTHASNINNDCNAEVLDPVVKVEDDSDNDEIASDTDIIHVDIPDLDNHQIEDPNKYIVNIESDPLELKEDKMMESPNMSTNKDNLFKCGQCDATFNETTLLSRHLKVHRAPVATCSDCPKTFSSLRARDRHYKMHVDATKRFTCDKCLAAFHRRDQLVMHLRTHHSTFTSYAGEKIRYQYRAGELKEFVLPPLPHRGKGVRAVSCPNHSHAPRRIRGPCKDLKKKSSPHRPPAQITEEEKQKYKESITLASLLS